MQHSIPLKKLISDSPLHFTTYRTLETNSYNKGYQPLLNDF